MNVSEDPAVSTITGWTTYKYFVFKDTIFLVKLIGQKFFSEVIQLSLDKIQFPVHALYSAVFLVNNEVERIGVEFSNF
jgi:hypothetical protein